MTGDRSASRGAEAAPQGRGSRRLLALGALMVAAGMTTACGQQPSPRGGKESVALEASAGPSATSPTATPAIPSAAPESPTVTEPAAPQSEPHGSGDRVLRLGASGTDVGDLQRRLVSLGYWLAEPDGTYGFLTEQAVLALQKTVGVSPDGVFGPRTRAALDNHRQLQPRRTVGSGVEVDLRRQLLIHVRDGVPKLILNASTGSGATYPQDGADQVAVTPTGRYTVYREVDGRDTGPLGDLWRPKYIVGGVAIHGYTSVPAFPASHGCIRVSVDAMDHLWATGALPVGSSVWVY